MYKVALVIIYNHQYNQNIEILERMYEKRFSNIYHLVPFYKDNKSNVIPVYCSSYYFQGYVAQGFKNYFNEDFEHYFFIGDDLILNPLINESNYREHLKLEEEGCFIPRLSPLNESKVFWAANFDAMLYDTTSPSVEVKGQLPGYDEAYQLLKNQGVENGPLYFNQIWKNPKSFKEWRQKFSDDKTHMLRYFKNKITKKKYNLTYPLVRSYSDIFVVSSGAIKMFCHYCGVFAATKLFAELAIPTAIAFSAKKITTERDLSLKGRALWTKKDLQVLNKYDNRLQNLLKNFPSDHLYLHPVKLSKWDTTFYE
ncbi:MAG TPA: hypothetical protein VGP55_04265 [Chitinophagaceae bacterium]|nr:hypothetical protein [Chitinophagaceae bacterium]